MKKKINPESPYDYLIGKVIENDKGYRRLILNIQPAHPDLSYEWTVMYQSENGMLRSCGLPHLKRWCGDEEAYDPYYLERRGKLSLMR